jgi:predicted nucleic acid-binding protein
VTLVADTGALYALYDADDEHHEAVAAAVMATTERFRTERILTVDRRDFRIVVSRRGEPFRLLPADRE